MRSSVSTSINLSLSIIIMILLFNPGTMADTVSATKPQSLPHHHGSSYSLSPQTTSNKDPGSRVIAPAFEAEAILPYSTNPILTTYPSPSPAQVARFPHLSALCANTTFQPGLYLHCHSHGGPYSNAIHGGLTNAWNRYTSCIRSAIDAGANMAIAPLMLRDNENLSNLNWKQVGPEAMLDVEGLQRGLKEVCPGMDVKGCPDGSCDEGSEYAQVLKAPDREPIYDSFTIGKAKEMVNSAITKNNTSTFPQEDISPERPLRVEYGNSMLGWNYTAGHESAIQSEIYQILNFSPYLLSLGEKVQAAAKRAANGRDIVGVHFRAEADWPDIAGNASVQMEAYVKELEKWKVKDVYLSCGDQQKVHLFREAMNPLGITVHDKNSLLNNTEGWGDEAALGEIERLNFDQKAVVEYVNLRDASKFLGLLTSALSHMVAYERTLDQNFDAPMDAGKADAEEKVGWFEKYILAGSRRTEGLNRHLSIMNPFEVRGDESTKLLVIDRQGELTDFFP